LTFESRLMQVQRSNVKFRSSTRINTLLVVLVTPTFAFEPAAEGCKCRSRTTSAAVALIVDTGTGFAALQMAGYVTPLRCVQGEQGG
jgi:hypothetical protein